VSGASVESKQVASAPRWHYGWPLALVLLTLMAAVTVVSLWPSVLSITHVWLNSETYQHGMVILPLALYMAWTRRAELVRVAPAPSLWGLAWLAAAGIAWMLARSVDVELVQHFALVAMLPGLVLTLLGARVTRLLVFPLGYLFFAVPFGNFVVPLLQDFTAWFAVVMLRLSGLPVYQDGYYISIPAGDFVVEDVCSGVRYLIASLALGLLYAYISYRSLWRRLAFVALAITVPILANGLRAYGIIMIAHWTDMRHAVGVDHLIYGWLFFGLVMLLLFWLGSFWWEKTPNAVGSAASAAPAIAPVASRDQAFPSAPVTRGQLVVVLGVLSLILVAPRAGELWLSQRAQRIAVETHPELPAAPPGWEGPRAASGAWRPQYHDADAEVAGTYRKADTGEAAELHLYQYLNRGAGTELISYRNSIHDGRTWRRSSETEREISRDNGDTLTVHETVLSGPRKRVVWHWYQAGGYATTRGVVVRLREAQALVVGEGRGSLLLAVSAEAGVSLDQTRSTLAAFISELPPGLIGHD